MEPIKVIEALCRIVEEALALISDEQQRQALNEAFEEAIGGKNVQNY